MTEPGKPKHAATVILLRPGETRGFEVFLTRRPDGMPFLGSMYCYPGGTVSKEDCRAAMVSRTVGRTPKEARRIIGAAFTPTQAIGLWVAAVREVFEEVGVLLAADSAGAKMSMSPERAGRLIQHHHDVSEKRLSFSALLEREQLYCDLASLSHFSSWQTPAQFAMRFDTRFFAVDASAIAHRVENVVHPDAELVELVWLPIAEARNLDLPTVTGVMLQELEARVAAGFGHDLPVPYYRMPRKIFLRKLIS